MVKVKAHAYQSGMGVEDGPASAFLPGHLLAAPLSLAI